MKKKLSSSVSVFISCLILLIILPNSSLKLLGMYLRHYGPDPRLLKYFWRSSPSGTIMLLITLLVIVLMIVSFFLNKLLLLGTNRTEMKIISSEASLIREAILSRVDRGVTILHGEGGYLHTPTEVILSVVSNHEMPRIERLARDIDPNCFIIVSQVTEVWGRGFSQGKHYAAKQNP